MTINTGRYKFIADALNGEGGFMPIVRHDSSGNAISVGASYLVKYPREADAKFARRNEVAWYENSLLPACLRFVGYLSKKPPVREFPAPLLADFANDCNWRGDALDVFWQGFMVQAKARGCMLLIVDMPRTLPGSVAEQIEQRAIPYLVPVAPERVVDYAVGQRGKLIKVEYSDTLNGDTVIRGWDESLWWVRKGNDILEMDEHGLGVCPVLAFSENGEFPFIGPFSQIADLSKRLFNARSELDEILRSQTFSLLTYHIPPESTHAFDAKTTAEAIGTHNMLIHNGDAPAFIAPPDGPANTYLETIAHIEAAIKRIGLAVDLPEQQSAESGLALTIRFESLNSALTSFARRMEDLERSVWMLVSAWLGMSAVGSCEWSKDYALADLAAELQTLANMIASGLPDEVIKQQKKVITQLAFPALPQEAMSAILDAIDAATTEITPDATLTVKTQEQAAGGAVDRNTGTPESSGDAQSLSAIMARLDAMSAAAAPNITVEAPQINVMTPLTLTLNADDLKVAANDVATSICSTAQAMLGQIREDIQNMPVIIPAPVVHVAAPNVTIEPATVDVVVEANLPTPEINIQLPARRTDTVVTRNDAGEITSATQIERDIKQ